MNIRSSAIVFMATMLSTAAAFSTQAPLIVSNEKSTSTKSKSPLFEHLKFDKNPQFDVLSLTQEYIAEQSSEMSFNEKWYSEDYVLRGPVVGPINRSDLAKSQNGLGIKAAFPDIHLDTFGYTIDPENPYRCFYFQRWRGTNSGDLNSFGTIYPATNAEMEAPVSVFSVVFNPDQKIVYEQVGAVVDRLEGNTQGKAAVFGMLHTAGLKISASPGDKVFAFIQRLGHLAGNMGRSWSREDEIPKWWVSKSRGADGTEQW